VATGFGLNSSVLLSYDDLFNVVRYLNGSFRNSFLVVDEPWFVVELFNGYRFSGLGLDEKSSGMHAFVNNLERYSYDPDIMDPYAPYSSAPIRCIKN
jgi:hypothetical protein